MSKKNRSRKQAKVAEASARKLTVGKVVRLLLKSLLFAVLASVLLVVLDVLGVPGLTNPWIQGIAIVVLYLIAYPFLMSEFRAGSTRADDG